MEKIFTLVILMVSINNMLTLIPFKNVTEDKVKISGGKSTLSVGSNISITVIYDNNQYKKGLETDWGFSCLIKTNKEAILFDTGGDGSILLSNMKKQGIKPGEIDMVVLSHIHGDHVGGLSSFLKKNPDVIVYLPRSFPESFKNRVRKYGAEVIEVKKPMEICAGIYSTGELGTWVKEQSLIINTEKGLIVITGCAHPGVVKIINTAKELLGKPVLLVLGGFHLVGRSKQEIDRIIHGFRNLGVHFVGPCHCSGDLARELFKKEYKKNFINIGVGRVITMDDLK